MNSSYIINITSQLDSRFNQLLIDIGSDLQSIKAQDKNIRNIVLRGGAIVDILLGLKPSDFDLFYSYEEDGEVTGECKCDEVREALNRSKLVHFDKDEIDLENSYEKEPKAEPIERTCGLISFHKDYISMFCIDEEGQVWTNTQGWECFKNKTYEVRYEGFLPWAYFPHKNDVNNYYSALARSIVRGIGYIGKRNLKPGDNFLILLSSTPYYVKKTQEQTNFEQIQKFALSKIGSFEVAKRVVDTISPANKDEVADALKLLFD